MIILYAIYIRCFWSSQCHPSTQSLVKYLLSRPDSLLHCIITHPLGCWLSSVCIIILLHSSSYRRCGNALRNKSDLRVVITHSSIGNHTHTRHHCPHIIALLVVVILYSLHLLSFTHYLLSLLLALRRLLMTR